MTYKKNWIPTLLTFLHVTFLFAPLYILVGSMAKLKGGDLVRFSIMGAFVIVPVVISYIILRKVKYLSVSVFLTIVLTGAGFAFGFWYGDFFHYGNVIMGAMNGMICLIIFLFRTYSKLTHNEMKEEFYAVHDKEELFLLEPWEIESFLSKPSVVHWAWFTILYVFALAGKAHYALYEIFILFVIDVFICFICAYSDHFFEYLKQNHRVANMPVSSMRNVHRQILLVGLMMIFLFVLPAVVYHKEPLEHVTFPEKAAITFDVPQQEADYEKGQTEPDTELALILAEYSQHEAPKWIRYMLDGILFLIAIATGFAMVYGVIHAIRGMARTFQLEDEDEVINLDEAEETRVAIRKRNRLQERFSEKAKIRREYRRAIIKGTKGTPKQSATPTELELELEAHFEEKIENQGLHEKYEKVRYGKEE